MGISISKAIIVSSGFGNRMRPLTQQMHKGTLQVGCKPNIVRLIEKLGETGVADVYVSTHYLSSDVAGVVGLGERFKRIKIHYFYEEQLSDTASKVAKIVFDEYRRDFKRENFVWVLACDIGFPSADLGRFKDAFLKYLSGSRGFLGLGSSKALGGLGFVVRPADDFLRKHPTAEINGEGIITGIRQVPPADQERAELVRSREGDPHIKGFEDKTGLKGLPLPTFFYILSPRVFKMLPKVSNRQEWDKDFYRHLFPLLPGKLWAYFFPEEEVINGRLVRGYYDFNTPEDYYRAQWLFVQTGYSLLASENNYLEDSNSYMGEDITRNLPPTTKVRDSVIGEGVELGENCHIRHSIIGQRCKIRNASIVRSVVLPFTEINSQDVSESAIVADSIVGGGIPTYFDREHSRSIEIRRKIASPGQGGQIFLSELNLNEDDKKLCEESFRKKSVKP